MPTVLEAKAAGANITEATVAVIGNPNTGKTTVFNQLTGLRQNTGNYPGVTVEKTAGRMHLKEQALTVLDLPGTYSLDANSLDERVVIDVLSGNLPGEPQPNLLVVVADASNIKRNLFLASQVAEFGIPMVLVLNLWDVAQRRGIRIDAKRLESQLGTVVVPMNAKTGQGIDELKTAIAQTLAEPRHMTTPAWPDAVSEATRVITAAVEDKTGKPLPDYLARRMLFDNSPALADRWGHGEWRPTEEIHSGRKGLETAGMNPSNAEALLRYQALETLTAEAIETSPDRQPHSSESIDKLLCHRVWGFAIFLAIMGFVFQSVYAWAEPAMNAIEDSFGAAGEVVAPWLDTTPMLQSLVVDGIIGGVGGVVVFLPQIFILFFFVGLLESTGYMARAAFLMDRLFGWCGLNGKCFIPLLSSYACAIPGILAARTIEDPKARVATIFIAPLMSCSARLPVYVLFIGAFVEPIYGPLIAGATLFALHFVGLAVAIPIAAVLNRYILKTPPQPFLLEMPSYKVPGFRDLLLRMWLRGREFLVNAGTIIFAFSIIIWALLYFPHPESVAETARAEFVAEASDQRGATVAETESALAQDEAFAAAMDNYVSGEYLEQSVLARFGKFVQPVFEPMGMDWKLTVGVLASFPARELIVSTLGIIYRLGPDVDEETGSLRSMIARSTWQEGPRAGQPVVTLPVALAVMVFFALCMQCGATVATIAREVGWKWAGGSFATATLLAWVCAVAVYQIGTAIGL